MKEQSSALACGRLWSMIYPFSRLIPALLLILPGAAAAATSDLARQQALEDSRPFALAVTGVQFFPELPAFIVVDEETPAADADVVAIFQEFHGLPWDAFIAGESPPQAWLAEMERFADGARRAGLPVFLNLQMAGGSGRRYLPDRTKVLPDGQVWKVEPYGDECFDWFESPGADDYRRAWLDYLDWMIAKFEPDWLNYGLEINFFKDCPEAWPSLKKMTRKTYERARLAAPGMAAFPSFNLDRLYGLSGDACPDDPGSTPCLERQLAKIAEVPRDRFAISTYPYGHEGIDTPADVPDDWFDRIAERVDEPLLIGETGWNAEPIVARLGADCVEAVSTDALEQAEWFDWLVTQAERHDMELLTWWSGRDLLPSTVPSGCPCNDVDWCPLIDLFRQAGGDQPAEQFFGEVLFKFWGTMGVRDHDGELRQPLADRWQAQRARCLRDRQPPPALIGLMDFQPVSEQPLEFIADIYLPGQIDGLPELQVSNAEVLIIQDDGPARFRAHLLADEPDRVVSIKAIGQHASVERKVLPIGDRSSVWGIPESVPGLVNTAGWEDGAEVSPDGQWLLVSTASPVDLLACLEAGVSQQSSACGETVGSWQRPARALAPGQDRVDSEGQIIHAAESLCLTEEVAEAIDLALPPVGSFLFRRQSDGSFGQPRLINFGLDGAASAPFGLAFADYPGGRDAEVVFAFADPRERELYGDAAALYRAPLRLGLSNRLTDFACVNDEVTAQRFVPERLQLPDRGSHKGNPHLETGRVWFDNEQATISTIAFSERTAAGQWQSPVEAAAPINQPGIGSYQPHRHADRLYFARGFRTIESARLGGNPAIESAWDEGRVELGLNRDGTQPGDIIGLGEPSLAVDADDREWLYFVYIQLTETGYSANVGRVAARPTPVSGISQPQRGWHGRKHR